MKDVFNMVLIATALKLSRSITRRAIRDRKKEGLLETEQRYRTKAARAVCFTNSEANKAVKKYTPF